MISENGPEHCTSQSDDIAQQCFMFLLGEMDPFERKRFESRLDDPAVSEELLRQSETLLQISETTPIDQRVDQPAGAQSPGNLTTTIIPHFPAPPRNPAVTLFVTIATLAAAVFFAVTLTRPDKDQEMAQTNAESKPLPESTDATAEDFLIAKAWVTQPTNLSVPAEPTLLGDWSFDTHSDIDSDDDELDDSGSDETFAWMVVAVESGDDVDG